MIRRALIILPLCVAAAGCLKPAEKPAAPTLSPAAQQQLEEDRMRAYVSNREVVVRDVQLALNRKLGLRLRVDGKMGRQTSAALKKFQRSSGLPITGRIDRETLRALGLPQ